MTGRFIVLDGIDGCGKSTQIRHLAQWLPASGLMPSTARLICTREPGGTPLGQSIRELLLHTEADQVPSVTAELLLYAADRAQHVDSVIRPALLRGDWVLSDRFAGSTLAYQGYGRGLDRQLITRLESIATTGLEPDRTAWLMVPVEVSWNGGAEYTVDLTMYAYSEGAAASAVVLVEVVPPMTIISGGNFARRSSDACKGDSKG